MALGDSFTYGLVSYPDAVMTRARGSPPGDAAHGTDLDLLNFGIGGTGRLGLQDTRVRAGRVATFDPDLVVVNLYLGNDGPDLFVAPAAVPRGVAARRSGHPYLAALRDQRWSAVARGLDRHVVATAPWDRGRSAPPHARGGDDGGSPRAMLPPDRSGSLTGPIYS